MIEGCPHRLLIWDKTDSGPEIMACAVCYERFKFDRHYAPEPTPKEKPHPGHSKTVCRYCQWVIVQCRCPSPKRIEYGVCEKCVGQVVKFNSAEPFKPAEGAD